MSLLIGGCGDPFRLGGTPSRKKIPRGSRGHGILVKPLPRTVSMSWCTDRRVIGGRTQRISRRESERFKPTPCRTRLDCQAASKISGAKLVASLGGIRLTLGTESLHRDEPTTSRFCNGLGCRNDSTARPFSMSGRGMGSIRLNASGEGPLAYSLRIHFRGAAADGERKLDSSWLGRPSVQELKTVR